MKPVFAISVVCAAALALPALAGTEVGDYHTLPPDLAAAATAYDVAQFKTDAQGLGKYLADDYVIVAFGKSQTKAQVIAGSQDPDRKTPYVALSQPVFRYWQDGAALGGIVDAKGTDHGKPFTLHAQFVDVWAKRDGRWQVVFTQIDNLP